ncbi:MAG: hypothetical protein JW699_01675 [Chitinispirillaceae bacterium]|nr:hypothetical protein [Chitinispirillaceae bacterium]
MAALKTAGSIEGRLRLNPDSLVFSRVADLYRKAGKIDKAIDICENGIARHPEYVTGHLVLGRCYLQRKRWEEAAGALSNACRIDWRNLAAIKMLARTYLELGLSGKAGDLYALILKLDPCDKLAGKKAAQTKGQGISDILEIIGETPAAEVGSDHTVVSARTAAKPPVEEPEGAFEFPPLTAGAGNVTEEMLNDATVISGADITDRIGSMFGEGPSLPKPPAKKEPPHEDALASFEGQPYFDATTVTANREDILGKDTIHMPVLKEPPPAVPEKPLEVELEETMIMDANEAMLFKGDSGIKIKDTGAPATLTPDLKDEMPAVEELAVESAESLDDIISGITKETPSAAEAVAEEALDAAVFEPPKEAAPPVAADTGAEDTLSGDDVAERLEGIFKIKKKTHDKEPPAAKEETRTKAVKETEAPAMPLHTGIAAEKEEEKTAVAPSLDDTLSGDDVIARLDGIFDGGKKKEKEPSGESATAVPPPSKQEETDTFKTRLLDKPVKAEAGSAALDTKKKDDAASTDDGPERTAVEMTAPAIPSPFEPKAGEGESFEETLVIEAPSEILTSKKKEKKPPEDKEDTLSLSETITAARVEAQGDSESPKEKPREDKEDTLSLSETISATKTGDVDAETGKTSAPEQPKAESGAESTAVFEDFAPGAAAVLPSPELPVFEPKGAAASAAEIAANIEKKENPDDLPDQVLSPTLANIYLEQGQPQFALKICRRLAAKDPGNEEFKRKIAELEKTIAKGSEETARPQRPRRGRARKKAAAKNAAASKPDDSKVILPLAGVRLRKKTRPKRKSPPPAGAQE